jgi:transposase
MGVPRMASECVKVRPPDIGALSPCWEPSPSTVCWAMMTIELPTDGEVFLAYLEQVVCPRLRPGRIVVMDNLSAHKHPQVRTLIGQTGAQLLYLPPYSPDFNPIEQCWAKIKEYLRGAKARLFDALEQAITAAIATITMENSAAWFYHCGYRIHQL